MKKSGKYIMNQMDMLIIKSIHIRSYDGGK